MWRFLRDKVSKSKFPSMPPTTTLPQSGTPTEAYVRPMAQFQHESTESVSDCISSVSEECSRKSTEEETEEHPKSSSVQEESSKKSSEENTEEDKKHFTDAVKKQCWQKAALIQGRDPRRWRQDPAGNYLMEPLHCVEGVHGYQFDHVVPRSKGGLGTVDNCQILQTAVNRAKKDKLNFTKEEMILASKIHDFKGCFKETGDMSCTVPDKEYMDALELAAYGDIKREGRECRAYKVHEITGLRLPPNWTPRCGQNKEDDEVPVAISKKGRPPKKDGSPGKARGATGKSQSPKKKETGLESLPHPKN